ncbi:low choriolytic enzyme-like [Megalops cyprinoides]|uniref:low choriolytic enzyme-like n=1 Tax=Megalops cyprinoides TaxID=118141 RepID=UPI001863CD7F|nr:low choriolytic enzyme-like [Megalops cyprinoides]
MLWNLSSVIPTSLDSYSADNSIEKEELSVSALIEKANKNIGQKPDKPFIIFGDIAVNIGLQNADPCTSRKCKWVKHPNGTVYVPYVISNQYSTCEKSIIEEGLKSFHSSTCIRFIPRTTEKDYLDIKSDEGCYSYVGRQGRGQVVSLAQQGCVCHGIVQHEILHALGFVHEQTRSDRDQHVKILYENIEPDMESNFRKIETNNLETPYDYNSVMEYGRYAFSKNKKPTIIPIPDESVEIGKAKEMSPNDILRVNRLYECSATLLYNHKF